MIFLLPVAILAASLAAMAEALGERKAAVVREISKLHEEVRSGSLATLAAKDGYDLLVVVDGKNLREVAGFVSERLSSLEGVIATATHFRLKSYKENGVVLARGDAPTRLAVSP